MVLILRQRLTPLLVLSLRFLPGTPPPPFLVACYATLHPALSVRPSVRRSVRPLVRPSVGPSHFTFSASMGFLAIPLLPKCSTDLKYGPCPPARDWGSRVSGLVTADREFTRYLNRIRGFRTPVDFRYRFFFNFM